MLRWFSQKPGLVPGLVCAEGNSLELICALGLQGECAGIRVSHADWAEPDGMQDPDL